MEESINALINYVLMLKKKGVKHIYLNKDNNSFLHSFKKPDDLAKKNNLNYSSPQQKLKQKSEKITFYQFNELSSYCFLVDYSSVNEEFSKSKQKELLVKIAKACQADIEKESVFLIQEFTKETAGDSIKKLKEKISTFSNKTKIFLMGKYSTQIFFPNKNFSEISFTLQNFAEKQALISLNLNSYLQYSENKKKSIKKKLWILINKILNYETE